MLMIIPCHIMGKNPFLSNLHSIDIITGNGIFGRF